MTDTLNNIMQRTAKLESLADVNEVVKDLSRLLKKTVSSSWIAVYFFDREQRNFTPAHSFGLPARYRHLFREMPLAPDKILLLKKMLRRKQHLQITDCATSELLTPRFRRLLGNFTLLAVPMVVRTQIMGAMFVTRARRQPPFSEQEIAMIRDMVSHAALVVSHMRLFDDSLEMALENARLYEDMRTLFISTVASLSNAIDAKSPWTKGHSERVMHVAVGIAREMGLTESDIERVRLGALLHDIGKIGIIEALLDKPEQLEDDEFPPFRLHPEKGVAILAPIGQLTDVLPGILYHHERYDGAGYPKGIAGHNIPLEARIIAVADAFDAMVSDRPYKKGLSVVESMKELKRGADSQFDPDVVACFCSNMNKKMGYDEMPDGPTAVRTRQRRKQ
ncbi:MAG: HD domain-containing phosphohydrolase [Geobacteraceae bacterium]